MRLVSGAKYADLLYRYQRTSEARAKAEKLAADRLSTITRLAALVEDFRDEKPDTPVAAPKAVAGDPELRRQLALAQRALRELSDRLDDMQTSHIADTRELHHLRQGASS